MAKLDEILALSTDREKVAALREKDVYIPQWGGEKGLKSEYFASLHPVMNTTAYPDIVTEDARLVKVSRITYDLQRLAVARMTELVTGIPVQRVYKPANDRQQEVADIIEKIFMRNHIDSVNVDRCNKLFAGCEVMTLWYAVEEQNYLYGVSSPIKMRCKNYSPVTDRPSQVGDELYPLFDEYGDMIALSVGYQRKLGRRVVRYFDTYTADRHLKWSTFEKGEWALVVDEPITLGKIPAIYMYRPTPIWEDKSNNVYELEWSMSRNGNYLRDNSKPLFIVFADEDVNYGEEEKDDPDKVKGKSVLQYPKGSSAQYVTWQQAVENLKFHTQELREQFFSQLQLPDWSYEKMSQQALSGESRKQLFIDAQLKVKDESGRLITFFDREVNVVKSFAKIILGESYAKDIDALQVEVKVTPFTITDEKEKLENLSIANGGKPMMSQRQSIQILGWSDNADETMQQIADESAAEKVSNAIESPFQ